MTLIGQFNYKLKPLYPLVIIMFLCFESVGQVMKGPADSTRISGKVYNKKTKKWVSNLELMEIARKHPFIFFQTVYNKYGEIDTLFYDPDNINEGKSPNRKEENQTKPGEIFPEYVFRTIDDIILDSEKLKGKWVLLSFDLLAKPDLMKKLSRQSDSARPFVEKDQLVLILCMADTKAIMLKKSGQEEHVFNIVSDGGNFHGKFNIVSFPTRILIDPEGRVVKYFHPTEEIRFKKFIK